jgi:hypothetical protein
MRLSVDEASRVWRVALAVTGVAIFFAAVAPAEATLLGPKPESLGKFKVLGGHLVQQTDYLANYRLDDSDNCWVYHHQDSGSSKFDLKFDKGESRGLKWSDGSVDLRFDVSGTVRRSWNGSVRSEQISQSEDCPAATPLTDSNANCGTKKVNGERTGFRLAGIKNGQASSSGLDLAPFGPVLGKELYPGKCPSDSVYGGLIIPLITKNGMKELAKAKPGKKVTLGADGNATGPGPDGFAVLGEWETGSQTATLDWELRLRRVGG